MSELNTDYNTQAQIIELTEDQLEAVEGGRSQLANTLFNFIPYAGQVNKLSEALGGPTFGDLF